MKELNSRKYYKKRFSDLSLYYFISTIGAFLKPISAPPYFYG